MFYISFLLLCFLEQSEFKQSQSSHYIQSLVYKIIKLGLSNHRLCVYFEVAKVAIWQQANQYQSNHCVGGLFKFCRQLEGAFQDVSFSSRKFPSPFGSLFVLSGVFFSCREILFSHWEIIISHWKSFLLLLGSFLLCPSSTTHFSTFFKTGLV